MKLYHVLIQPGEKKEIVDDMWRPFSLQTILDPEGCLHLLLADKDYRKFKESTKERAKLA